MLVQVGPGTLHVMRESAWRVLVEGKDYSALAGARMLVLPDSATVEELTAAFSVAPSGTPTGAPP